MSRLVSLAMVSFCWAAFGCGLGVDDPVRPLQPDAGSAPESDGSGVISKPIVTLPPSSVCGDSVPIQGTAKPGASVFAQGGLETAGVATDAHPVTGKFCLDVRLKPDTDNLIEVRAQDPVLGLSEPTQVTVKQSGTCTDNTPPPVQADPQNIALGLKARSNTTPSSGNETFLTDGNPSTAVQYTAWGVSDDGIWLTIKLVKLTELGKIVVKWSSSAASGGSDYGDTYHVLISAMGDPGDPSLTTGYWTEVQSYDGGSGGANTVDLASSKPQALHVALWLSADAGWYNPYDTFTLAELEVWDSPKAVTQQAIGQTTTCQSLGL